MRKLVMFLIMSAVALVLSVPATPAYASPITSACDAVPGNLLVNCGFEQGFPTGWGLSNGTYSLTDPASIHSGNAGLALVSYSPGTLQLATSIATTPGDSYTLTFYLANSVGFSFDYGVDWGLSTVVPYTQYAGFPYTKFSYSGLDAVGLSTTLTLSAATSVNGHPMYVDDFSVVDNGSAAPVSTTPEPPALILLATGLLAGALLLWRRRRAGLTCGAA